jgi:hypothetical protein
MAKFVDKTRTGIPGSGLGPVVNRSAWSEKTATERYGGSTKTFPAPKDACYPQRLGDDNNLQGPRSLIDPSDWRRGGGGTAENRPGYVPGYRAPHGEPGDRGGPPLRRGAKGPHR